MIALDSSVFAFLAGATGRDADLVDRLFAAYLPPVVLTEMLSDPKLPKQVAELLVQIPRLELLPGYWERAGALRAKVLGQKRRARLADTLIAQSCIDHDVGLVTRDADFRQFVRAGGLRLVGGSHRVA
ncbi:PIN domain-containing protein [bacterium]|nr:PIN domain-containing protein [bacterium]